LSGRECGDSEESQGQMFGHASVLAQGAPPLAEGTLLQR
jgi:hypothetical protein